MNILERNQEILSLIKRMHDKIVDIFESTIESKMSELKTEFIKNAFTEFFFNFIILPVANSTFLIKKILLFLGGLVATIQLLLLWALITLFTSFFSVWVLNNNFKLLKINSFESLNKPITLLNPIAYFHHLVFSIMIPRITLKYKTYIIDYENYNTTQKVSYFISLILYAPAYIVLLFPILFVYFCIELVLSLIIIPIWLIYFILYIFIGI